MKENFEKLLKLIKAAGIKKDFLFYFPIKRNDEPILLEFGHLRYFGLCEIFSYTLDGIKHSCGDIDFDLTSDEVYEILKFICEKHCC